MREDFLRLLRRRLELALADTPVVLVNGARQTGKTTLARQVALGGRFLTLDDPTVQAAAVADPVGFVRAAPGLTVIDEVQKAPGLFGAIKLEVDADRRPGRFLLTGSADVFMLPQAAESLAGRMEVLSLHPFAQVELRGLAPTLVPALFANAPPDARGDNKNAAALIATGGFPEAVTRKVPERRRAWFDAYVTTITQRDVRDLSGIAGLTALPRLLSLMAARSGALLNVAELSRASGIPQATLHRYLALLEATFLYQPLAAWHTNLGKRLIRAPKLYLLDSGLACALTGVDAGNAPAAPHYGGLLETFVLGELRRLLAAMPGTPRVYHYRSAAGAEVDFVLEDAAGKVVGIEVKATSSLGDRQWSGLKDLAQAAADRFTCGIILYGGDQPVHFGERFHALPLSALWSSGG